MNRTILFVPALFLLVIQGFSTEGLPPGEKTIGMDYSTDRLPTALELQKELDAVIASSETLLGRDYWAAILRFTNRGPNQRFYRESLPPTKWKDGIPVCVDIEIHTEEEVAAGQERNRMARAAVAELCTNRLDQLSIQTQEKLVECMYNLWGNDLFPGLGKQNSVEDHIDFLSMAEAILAQPKVSALAKSRVLFFVRRQSDNLRDPVEKQKIMQRFEQQFLTMEFPHEKTPEKTPPSLNSGDSEKEVILELE